MPLNPTQPTSFTRYFRVGVTQVVWCPTIANKATPTFAELNAGTELTAQIQDWAGWSVSTNFVDTPDMKNRFTGQIPGRITSDASTLTIYVAKTGTDLRALMTQDSTGFVVISDGGLVSGKGDVFPVQVGSVSPVRDLGAAAAAVFSFAILEQPAQGVTLPQSGP